MALFWFMVLEAPRKAIRRLTDTMFLGQGKQVVIPQALKSL